MNFVATSQKKSKAYFESSQMQIQSEEEEEATCKAHEYLESNLRKGRKILVIVSLKLHLLYI